MSLLNVNFNPDKLERCCLGWQIEPSFHLLYRLTHVCCRLSQLSQGVNSVAPWIPVNLKFPSLRVFGLWNETWEPMQTCKLHTEKCEGSNRSNNLHALRRQHLALHHCGGAGSIIAGLNWPRAGCGWWFVRVGTCSKLVAGDSSTPTTPSAR